LQPVVQFPAACSIEFSIGAKISSPREIQCQPSLRPAFQDHSMDMEQRIRAVWKTVPEAHKPFSEYVGTTFEAIVKCSRYMRLSHSSTANRQQSMVDGSLDPVTNDGNSEIEAFASTVSLEGQQHRKRKRKKQRKKKKFGTNPLSPWVLNCAWNLLEKLQCHRSGVSCLHEVPSLDTQLGWAYCPKASARSCLVSRTLRDNKSLLIR